MQRKRIVKKIKPPIQEGRKEENKMKNKDLKKYSIALSVLTLQMKSLRNMAVRGPKEQAKSAALCAILQEQWWKSANRLHLSKPMKKLAKMSATNTKTALKNLKERLKSRSAGNAAKWE